MNEILNLGLGFYEIKVHHDAHAFDIDDQFLYYWRIDGKDVKVRLPITGRWSIKKNIEGCVTVELDSLIKPSMKQAKTTKQPLEDSKGVKYFVNDGNTYIGTEWEAKQEYDNYWVDAERRGKSFDSFETWCSENLDLYQPDSKEGLHTQGEWYVSSILNIDKHMCATPYHEISVRDGKRKHWWLAQVNASENAFDLEESKANAELIVKAVNERKALLDALEKIASNTGFANRELVEIAKTALNNAKNI